MSRLNTIIALGLSLLLGSLLFIPANFTITHANDVELPAGARVILQNNVAWTAQFYDNPYQSGRPVLETRYFGLQLYWGQSSPDSHVPVDHFTARFGADPYFPAGTYRFFVQADDEVRVKIGSVPWEPNQLDTFDKPTPGQMHTFEVALRAGNHHIQVDFRENTGDAYVFLDWANAATNPQPPEFPIPVTRQRVDLRNPWTVQYFSNRDLAAPPVVARTETEEPTRHWGRGRPHDSVPVDNFSIRFVSFQNLAADIYELEARADDGVRVYVNGVLLIDEWHGAYDETYTAQFVHQGGDVTFTIEYYDATLTAFLEFALYIANEVDNPQSVINVQPPTPTPTPAPNSVQGANATVRAWRLNVRNAPSAENGEVIAQIGQGETYPIVGSNSDQSWWQIELDDAIGWVSARWVNVSFPNRPPTPTPTPAVLQQPAPTGYFVIARENVNIRSDPGYVSTTVGLLPYRQAAGIIGRTADNSWWQVRYGAVMGWVNNFYVDLQPGANLNEIPITR